MSDLKFKEITEKIIGASMKVHAAPGNGFQEIIYQRALEIELQESGLKFSREYEYAPSIIREDVLEKGELIFLLKKKSWLN